MSLAVGLAVVVCVLLWPERFDPRCLPAAPRMPSDSAPVPPRWSASARERVRRRLRGAGAATVTAQDLLRLLEAIAPALEAGMAPGPALRIAAEARSGSGQRDPLAVLVNDIAAAAAEGARLGPSVA